MSESMVSSQPPLLTIDRKTFIERIKAFNDEEWDLILELADTRKIKAEYHRRTDKVFGLYDDIQNTLSNVKPDTTTEEMEDIVKLLVNLLNRKE